ncbi:hypothetical protein [Corticicoccus populi]|uniref:N-acetyltransferase n=1 Tax=Corticicoccus populi TaxID=1812821 RepID=A0ABW5WWT5_9STAP
MEIYTERLKLVASSPEFISGLSQSGYQEGPHVKAHLSELEKDPSTLGWGVWIILEKNSDVIIGDAGFKGKPSVKKNCRSRIWYSS